MRSRQYLAFGIAATAGLMAVFFTHQFLKNAGKTKIVEVETKVDTTPVVLAKTNVSRGRIIRPDQLKIVQWPSNVVPAGAFQSIPQIFARGEKRVALTRFSADEVVTRSRVSGPGQQPSLSLMLGPGMRAVTVRVNAVVGVGGFVTPGDKVDLLFTRRPSENQPAAIPGTSVLLRNVRVLGIDQETEEHAYEPRVASTVTVEVNLADAQKIARASNLGKISLALRSFEKPDQDLGQSADKKEPVLSNPEAKIVVFRSATATEYNVPKIR